MSSTLSNSRQSGFVQNVQVSVFANFEHSRYPICSADLRTVLFSEKNRSRIEELRTYEKGSQEFQAIKASLPCYTPSGLFDMRCKKGLLQHSGFVCIEWDKIDPAPIKEELAGLDFIYYAGLSCSGKGVFALVKVADGASHHGDYFRAFEAFFAKKGMPLDHSGSDVTRCRVASFDPNPIFREDSRVWDTILPAPVFVPRKVENADVEQRLFLLGLEYIQRHKIDVTGQRNTWLALGSTVKTLFGDGGEDYFVALSQYYPGFLEPDCRQTFRSLQAGNYGLGVFANACRRAGVPNLNTL